MITLQFTGDSVALIVRGKTGPEHQPDLMNQHADCVLSDGACIGFFGEGAGLSGSGGSLGLGMRGETCDMGDLAQTRP